MATLSRAVARPFSYVVWPVDVISIGAFSGVLISPYIKPALANTPASNKPSDRMANAKRTAANCPCKAKTSQPAEILPPGAVRILLLHGAPTDGALMASGCRVL